MTTGESTDNVDMENVTITSDEAFERVTSDEHFEEEEKSGYLQQNTSGLVQEIPNISFLDIGDTMLENKKTLYERKNWVLRVGNNGKSIEAQPQDTILLRLTDQKTYGASTDERVSFDTEESSGNYTTCKPDNTYMFNGYKVKILQTGYYTISYGRILSPGTSYIVRIGVESNAERITYDYFDGQDLPSRFSGGKTIHNIKLEAGDIVGMKLYFINGGTLYKDTYMCVQFQQYIL